MKPRIALLVAGLALSPALASAPGQPPDCSDWVFHEPGLSCTVWQPYAIDQSPSPPELDPRTYLDEISTFDRAQRLIRARMVYVPPPQGCLYPGDMPRTEIYWSDGTNEGVIAHIQPRCNHERFEFAQDPTNVEFDPISGTLLLGIGDLIGCWNGSELCSPFEFGWWTAAIHGFTTTFEILQTVAPQTPQTGFHSQAPQNAQIGFRVPSRPEGMAAADHFDTYWGDLAHPIDFAQAHPLQCSYPVTAPHVGDYLTVADTIPTPAPGQGVYYITSATYQGATRFGRTITAGHFTARDPSVLPVCTASAGR